MAFHPTMSFQTWCKRFIYYDFYAEGWRHNSIKGYWLSEGNRRDRRKTNSIYALQEPYSMVVHYDEDSHDVASSFRKPTYRIRISVCIRSTTSLTVASLLNTSVGLNLINRDFPSVVGSNPSNRLSRHHFERRLAEWLTSKASCICLYAWSIYAYAPGLELSNILSWTYCLRLLLSSNGNSKYSQPNRKASLGIQDQNRLLWQILQ